MRVNVRLLGPTCFRKINRTERGERRNSTRNVLSSSFVPDVAASLLRLSFVLIASRFEGAGTQSVVGRHAV